MKKFSDLGITVDDDRKIFECKQVSITEIINCEIIVHDFLSDMKTRHGEDRYLVRYSCSGSEGKFFTNSKRIKSALDNVPNDAFPFSTVIKCLKVGQNSTYMFT